MYEFIWRALPGNWFVKLLISLLLIAGVVFVLMQWVFPVIAPYMPFNDATVDEGSLPTIPAPALPAAPVATQVSAS